MRKTYTYRRAFYWESLLLLLFFSVLFVLSTVGIVIVAPRKANAVLVALPLGVVWSIFVWFARRRLRAWREDRIIIDEGRIEATQKGESTRFLPEEVESAWWPDYSDTDGIEIATRSQILRIKLDRFSPNDREAILREFHGLIPQVVQHGWLQDFDLPSWRRRYKSARRLGWVLQFAWAFFIPIAMVLPDFWPQHPVLAAVIPTTALGIVTCAIVHVRNRLCGTTAQLRERLPPSRTGRKPLIGVTED